VWCLRTWPGDSLRDDPGFTSLLEEQEARLAAQRRRLEEEGLLLTPAQLREHELSYDIFRTQ
jgi:hypothetical protein